MVPGDFLKNPYMNRAEFRLSQALILLGYDEDKYSLHTSHNLLASICRYAQAVGETELALACEQQISRLVLKAENARQETWSKYPLEDVTPLSRRTR